MEQIQKYFKDKFHITPDEWDLINQHTHATTLHKGKFFIEQHKVCRHSGFILHGVMRYFSYNESGDDPTCYFSYENQYITDPFTFKKQTPSDMNLQAVTDCEIAVISYENDKKLSSLWPKWNDITNQVLLDVSIDFANQKALLAMNASERYDYFMEKFPTVALRVPLQYVASYLGIKQPSLSRVRKNAAKSK